MISPEPRVVLQMSWAMRVNFLSPQAPGFLRQLDLAGLTLNLWSFKHIAILLLVFWLFLLFLVVPFFFSYSFPLWFDDSLLLCLDSFLFFICVSIMGFWFVVTMRSICSNLHITILNWSNSYALCTLTPPSTTFSITYFTYFCLVYPLPTYYRYRWFCYLCLSNFLLSS